MEPNREIENIILICDSEGLIKEIHHQGSEFAYLFEKGESFLKNVDTGSISKSLTFFNQLKNNKIITNCEINFSYEKSIMTFVLSGAHDKDDLIILASSGQVDSFAFDEVMAINSDQVNLLRKIIKEKAEKDLPNENKEFKFYDEISRLNNELMNTQRELARKNNELKQLNIKLEELTIRDSLTNLFNKRYLYPKFEEETIRSSRFQYPITIAMIDLNNFKQINDQLGHNEGDRVLKKFAEFSTLYTRDGLDYVFRIGGDEFLILMTHCEEETAKLILSRIDTEYRKLNKISSIAYGVSSFIGETNQNLDELLKEVDRKMYEHKKEVKEGLKVD